MINVYFVVLNIVHIVLQLMFVQKNLENQLINLINKIFSFSFKKLKNKFYFLEKIIFVIFLRVKYK